MLHLDSRSEKYIVLHSCIKVVNGILKGAIYDLQKKEFYHVDTWYIHVLDSIVNKRVSDVRLLGFGEDEKKVYEFIKLLVQLEVIFLCIEVGDFLRVEEELNLETSWTHMALEISEVNENRLEDILNQLSASNVTALQLIAPDKCLNYFIKTFATFDFTSLDCVELILGYDKTVNPRDYEMFINRNSCISDIFVTSALKILAVSTDNVHYIQEKFHINRCGIIEIEGFNISKRLYSESLLYNSCLNGKLVVDKSGTIKNCPSLKESYGNVEDKKLSAVVSQPEFVKYWSISKDEILVCNVCEFRHMCIDCRAYTGDPTNLYSKPLKCGYDPYSGEWNEWSRNPLKKNVINYYGMNEMARAFDSEKLEEG